MERNAKHAEERIFSALGCFVVASEIFYCLKQSTSALNCWCEQMLQIPLSTYSVHILPSICEIKLSFEQDPSIFLA